MPTHTIPLVLNVHGGPNARDSFGFSVGHQLDGGRLTGVRITKARHEIRNKGGGEMDTMWLDQGVERDMIAQQQAAVRYSSTMGMEVDGSIKAKGIDIKTSRRVPPGMAIMGVKKSLKST